MLINDDVDEVVKRSIDNGKFGDITINVQGIPMNGCSTSLDCKDNDFVLPP